MTPRRCVVILARALALLAALAACARPDPDLDPPGDGAARAWPGAGPCVPGPGFLAELAPALERSLGYVRVKPLDAVVVRQDGLALTWGDLGRTLETLLASLPELDADPGLLARRFGWLRLGPEPLMTGYYAPILDASPVATAEFAYPLYALPPDVQTVDLGRFHPRWAGQTLTYRIVDGRVAPLPARAAIDQGGAWPGAAWSWPGSMTPWTCFPAHPGLGHPAPARRQRAPRALRRQERPQYVSLGKVLIERGLAPAEGMSMKVIREFLAAHPERMDELLATNPSYVFFRLGDSGPYGAMGKLLTPRVSVATDPGLVPLGAVLALEAVLPPEAPGGPALRVAGLALAQDTGGAIKGHRLDYYCGDGPDVEFLAGHIKDPATVHLLVSREVLP
jgi:membrane-bound lytic murein transglycosylase A